MSSSTFWLAFYKTWWKYLLTSPRIHLAMNSPQHEFTSPRIHLTTNSPQYEFTSTPYSVKIFTKKSAKLKSETLPLKLWMPQFYILSSVRGVVSTEFQLIYSPHLISAKQAVHIWIATLYYQSTIAIHVHDTSKSKLALTILPSAR